MAGNFQEGGGAEYNVRKDIASAQAVAALWPGEIVYSPYELGVQVNFPATVIEEQFPDVEPLPEAYKAYLPMPYDRPCWDPTALIYAVEGGDGFTVSDPGTIGVTEEGVTTFAPSPDGLHRYLSVTPEQAKALVERIVKMTTKD